MWTNREASILQYQNEPSERSSEMKDEEEKRKADDACKKVLDTDCDSSRCDFEMGSTKVIISTIVTKLSKKIAAQLKSPDNEIVVDDGKKGKILCWWSNPALNRIQRSSLLLLQYRSDWGAVLSSY